MPRIRLTLPGPTHLWTKVPNPLFDVYLPTLKDTEIRVLLVLIRQTSGFQREGRAVVLKYKDLIARTGRRSEAIAKALDSLADRGLIHRSFRIRRKPFRNPVNNTSLSEDQQ